MAKFTIVLDKRNKPNSKEEYNLTVRGCIGKHVIYLNIGKLTEKHYSRIFDKKSMDEHSIQYREKCNTYLVKAERIFSQMGQFDSKKFRELFYKDDITIPKTLLMKDLFNHYLMTADIKLNTKDHMRSTSNILESLKSNVTVNDITVDFLKKLEKLKIEAGCERATIDSYNRDIRTILNYYTGVEKIIPSNYDYPYGKGKYSISSFFPQKRVLSNDEIMAIVELNVFKSKDEEYARDIWLLLYRLNGINFVDLLRLRWVDIKGDFITLIRKKTETTRKNNIKEIVIPITPKLKSLIDKIGVKESPYIIGKLMDGYTESSFKNKTRKLKKLINSNLRNIGLRLNLSVQLTMSTARDAYATTLLRSGRSKDQISAMLGHSNSIVTEHYLASISHDETFLINDSVL